MKTACHAMLFLSLVGCASERALDWTYEIPSGLERSGTMVVARIRQGGCDDTDLIIYQAWPRSPRGGTEVLPVLVQGVAYCFEVRLQDASCTEYAVSFEPVEVDDSEVPAVLNRLVALRSGTEVACSNGLCDLDRGCRPCEEGTFFCPAEGGEGARCCSSPPATCDPAHALLCDELE